MAHAYTTKRGKTKKAKMGIRKDNKQNQEQGLKSNTQLLEHALFDDKPAFGLHALVQTNRGIAWTAIPLPREFESYRVLLSVIVFFQRSLRPAAAALCLSAPPPRASV